MPSTYTTMVAVMTHAKLIFLYFLLVWKKAHMVVSGGHSSLWRHICSTHWERVKHLGLQWDSLRWVPLSNRVAPRVRFGTRADAFWREHQGGSGSTLWLHSVKPRLRYANMTEADAHVKIHSPRWKWSPAVLLLHCPLSPYTLSQQRKCSGGRDVTNKAWLDLSI